MEVLDRKAWITRAQARLRRAWPSLDHDEAEEMAATLWANRAGKELPERAADDEIECWNGLLDSALD